MSTRMFATMTAADAKNSTMPMITGRSPLTSSIDSLPTPGRTDAKDGSR